MLSFLNYPAVSTKIRAILGKMLTDQDYRNLLEMDTVAGVFDYLYQNTYYHSYLEAAAGKEIHRELLERLLKKKIVEDYKSISYYLKGPARDFFCYLFKHFEIEDIKMLLRTVLVERDKDYMKENLVYLGKGTDISLERLEEANNYQDLLDIFSGTEFSRILARFADRYDEDKNLFPIEMSLDFHYFSRLEELAGKLGFRDRKVIMDLLGTQIDLLNINWVYRILKYYNLEFEEIINYTLPYYHNLNEEDLRQMARLEDADEIFNYLQGTKYSDLFSPVSRDKSNLFEKYFLSYLLQKAYAYLEKGQFNIGAVAGFTFIKEYEIRDIITIAEGIRYGLSGEELRNYLIRDWI